MTKANPQAEREFTVYFFDTDAGGVVHNLAYLRWIEAVRTDLAEKLGVSRQTINALERGKYDPSLPLAFKIAQLFKLKIEEIFEPDDMPNTKSKNAS